MSDAMTLQDRLIVAFKQNAVLRSALHKIADMQPGAEVDEAITIASAALTAGRLVKAEASTPSEGAL